jgi:hypothetical protein
MSMQEMLDRGRRCAGLAVGKSAPQMRVFEIGCERVVGQWLGSRGVVGQRRVFGNVERLQEGCATRVGRGGGDAEAAIDMARTTRTIRRGMR